MSYAGISRSYAEAIGRTVAAAHNVAIEPYEFDIILCIGFNPTATKGVFVSHDAQGNGSSLVGLPGQEAAEFNKGDWLIRAAAGQKSERDTTSAE